MKRPKFKSYFSMLLYDLRRHGPSLGASFCHFWPPSVTTNFLCVGRDVWVLLNSYLLCSSEESFIFWLNKPKIFNYLTITLKVKFLSRVYYAPQKMHSLYFTTNSFFFNNRRGNAVLLPLTCKSLPLKTTVSYSYTASKRVSRWNPTTHHLSY